MSVAKDRLRIAIQKSGRLSKDSSTLLKQCGLHISQREQRLIAHVENMPIDLLRVRDDDIPGLVMDGVCDLGIIGQNVLEEEALARGIVQKSTAYQTIKVLNFGFCKLSIAIPEEEQYQSIQQLNEKLIATTYPHLLQNHCQQQGLNIQPVHLKGSVEVAPRAGLADAICDLVSTGATLEANGLKEVETIYRSRAVLIQAPQTQPEHKQHLIDRLVLRLSGVIQAQESKYIMLHAPRARQDEIIALLPGVEDPTVLPLANDQDQVAIHVVSHENLFWETMEQLKDLGASSILVLPIEKMLK